MPPQICSGRYRLASPALTPPAHPPPGLQIRAANQTEGDAPSIDTVPAMKRFVLSAALLLSLGGGQLASAALQPAAQPLATRAAPAPGKVSLLCLPSGESTNRKAKVKPSSCNTLGAEDSFAEAANLAKLKWKRWGKSTATATGIERGFREPASKIKITVTASRLEANDCGGKSYTRIKVKSKFGTLRQSLPAVCDEGGAAAPASCQADGGGDMSEWTLIVTSLTGLECAGALDVIKVCAEANEVPDWTVSVASSTGPVFTSKDGTKSFATQAAGGSPKCVQVVYGY